MYIEHVAFALPEPAAGAAWYVEHLQCRIVRSSTEAPFAHFLLPPGGGVLIELFNNPAAPDADYASVHPFHIHLAFHVDDPASVRDRLVQAGAVHEEGAASAPAGDRYVMLRDPWGLPLQLVSRAQPLL